VGGEDDVRSDILGAEGELQTEDIRTDAWVLNMYEAAALRTHGQVVWGWVSGMEIF